MIDIKKPVTARFVSAARRHRRLLAQTCLTFLISSCSAVSGGSANAEDAPGVKWPEPGKRASISAPFRNSRITIGVSSRTAGAIDSLTWDNQEFVDRNDHGREFQSASVFGGKGECFNPTEAGSDHDSTGDLSTSKLLSLAANGNTLKTQTLMAFWIGPGDHSSKCHGTMSTVKSPLSDDLLLKTVTIGAHGIADAIEYDATFRLTEARTLAGFEALAGYMPTAFAKFWTYDPATRSLLPLSDGPGKQPLPIVFSTPDQRHAIGVYSPGGETSHAITPIYSRYRFEEPTRTAQTVKWNCYFEEHDVAAGDHTFTCYIVVGSVSDVESGISSLCKSTRPDVCH